MPAGRPLIHVLPRGFHRIRHYGLVASAAGADNIARARELLVVPEPQTKPADALDGSDPHSCPHCGGRMIIAELLNSLSRGFLPWRFPTPAPEPAAPSVMDIRKPSQFQAHAAQQQNSYSMTSSARALSRAPQCPVPPRSSV